MEKRSHPMWRYVVCVLLVALVFAVYVLRLYDWQILNGSTWLATADHSTQSTVAIPAARGEILDVNGEPLAVNRTGYAVVLNWPYMRQDTDEETTRQENETIRQIISLLDRYGEEWTDELPILVQDGAYVFAEGEDREIETLKGRDYANVNSYATADLCMEALIERYGVEGYTMEETRDIVSVRYNMVKNQFGSSNPYTVAPDVSLEIVTILSENSQSLPGVSIEVTTTREYENTTLIPHIVGRMGKFSSMEDWEQNYRDQGYAFDDSIGISGVESAFESTLRGEAALADFEGPLSLILQLLGKNKIEIRDISVSEILDQYLAYLDEMQRMDLEIASEFVQMAAYLLYIKTRTLLAQEKEVTELEELMSSLEKLRAKGARESIKAVLPELAAMSERGRDLFTRAQEPLPREARIYDYRHEPAELMSALLAAFSREDMKPPAAKELVKLAPKRIVYGVREKSRELIERLRSRGRAELGALCRECKSRSEVVAVFLSVLELCAMGSLTVSEGGGGLLLEFTGGDTEKLLEAIEEDD